MMVNSVRSRLCLIVLSSLAWFMPSVGIHLEGQLFTKENWAFVARFCFLPERGQLKYHIEYEKKYAIQNLLFYYDTPEQWSSAYRRGLACEQREAVVNSSNVARLYPPYDNCSVRHRGRLQEDLVVCGHSTRFRTARQRWWYLAVSNCNSTQGLSLKYNFLMTNGPPGDFWNEHFSADELYILPILISFVLAYVIMIVAAVVCSVQLKARKLYHTTYKMFLVSVVLQEMGILMETFAYARHAASGRGISRIRILGRLLEAASETVFLLLLLLLAKGFTVTRGRLRLASTVKLTIFMCLYTVAYFVIFVYERLFFDPGKVLYLYESPPGYALIVLRVLAWWLFVYSIVFTLKHYPEKAVFYYPFNMLGTLWFVAGPAFILATNSFVDKWVRESVVCGALHFITLCGHLQFLFLTLPTTANKVFPFHVRTTQVGAMQLADPDGPLPFFHHPYSPSAPAEGLPLAHTNWTCTAPVELFSVSRVVDERTEAIVPLKPCSLPGLGYRRPRTEGQLAGGESRAEADSHSLPHTPAAGSVPGI